jgi:transposase
MPAQEMDDALVIDQREAKALGISPLAVPRGASGPRVPLPSYSPQLQVIERFWKVLRRRATHNRLFPTMAQLKQTLRNNLCYYQTLKHRVLSVIQSARKRKKSSAA